MIKGGANSSSLSAQAVGIRVQSSIYGKTVPLVYGTTRVSFLLIFYNDWHQSGTTGGKKG
jgi:hypothetical protein